MRYQVKRVRGAQADMARHLGLVKIARSSAKDLFDDFGIDILIVGNNVNSHHFFGGWHLAHWLEAQRYKSEGYDFDHIVRNWEIYNENSETGKAAFFASKKDVAEAKKGRS